MTRRESRENAFLLVFEYDFNTDRTADDIIALAKEERGTETDEFARDLFMFVTENVTDIDGRIDRFIKNRSASRITRPGRAILRLAAAEILMGKTPSAVVINEAVELSKKYDADEMPAYVNGVLGAFVRSLDGENNA